MDSILAIAGIGAEILVLALLVRKHSYRSMPFFCAYIGCGVVSDLALLLIHQRYASQFLHAFIIQMCIDSALQYGVLIELAWCVLRPARATLPRGTVTGLALLVLAMGAACWPFCGLPNLPRAWHFLTAVQQSTSILRILFCLILLAGSHLLALGWHNRELQVASGLGSYSLVSFAATIVHSHQKTGASYHWVDVIVSLSFVGSLVYWIVSFVQQEAPRREFTPQMRSALLTIAAVTRSRTAQLETLQRRSLTRG